MFHRAFAPDLYIPSAAWLAVWATIQCLGYGMGTFVLTMRRSRARNTDPQRFLVPLASR